MSELTGIPLQGSDPYKMPYGNAYAIGNLSETVITIIDQYEKVIANFSSDSFDEFTIDATGKLTYIGTIAKHFHIVSNFDMTGVGINQTYAFRWYKNNITALSAPIERFVGTGTDIGAVSLHADTNLEEGDYIELKATNRSSTANLVLLNIYLFVMGMSKT